MCKLKLTKEILDSLIINYEKNKDVRLSKVATLTRNMNRLS